MTLWKGKGSKSDIASYRDITLTSQEAKVSGKWIRQMVVSSVANGAIPTQFGSGFNGGSTDVCQLYCKAAMALADVLSMSDVTHG